MFESLIAALPSAASASSVGNFLGGLGSFGNMLSGVFGGSASSSKRWANYWNQKNYELARDQLYSGTQIKAEDMRKAGINPILAASPGMSASAPQANVTPPNEADYKAKGMQARASMLNSVATALQLKKLNHEIALLDSQKDKNEADEFYSRMSGQNQVSQSMLNTALHSKAQFDAEASRLQLPFLRNSARAEDTWWKKNVAPFLGDVSKVSGAASSTKDSFNPAMRRSRSEGFFYRGD